MLMTRRRRLLLIQDNHEDDDGHDVGDWYCCYTVAEDTRVVAAEMRSCDDA